MYKGELVAGDRIPQVEVSAHSIVTAQSTGTGQGFQKFIYLFSIPEIRQSGYRTCYYIAVGRVQNEARQ